MKRSAVQTMVTRADVAASSMVQRLLAAGAPKAPRVRATKPATASDEALVLAALAQAPAEMAGLARCADVRALCSLDKARFDAACMRLFAARRISLYHHDAAGMLPEAERAQLVCDGRYYYNLMKAT